MIWIIQTRKDGTESPWTLPYDEAACEWIARCHGQLSPADIRAALTTGQVIETAYSTFRLEGHDGAVQADRTERPKFVGYLRVSTSSQGADGLGIDAQRAAVQSYVGDGDLLAEYVEVESGKVDERPELEAALRHARAANAVLVCARLDRLGRRASHVLTLLDRGGVPVAFADAPNAGALELGVRAIVAEEEGRKIGERTRAGLQAARARGVTLGNPNGAAALRRYQTEHGNRAGVEGAQRAADAFAERLRFAVDRIIAEGTTTASGIADALNAAGFPSRRGGRWHAASVQRLLARLEIDPGNRAVTTQPSDGAAAA